MLFIFFAGVSLASIDFGKKYCVKKGDSIYRIATKVFHIPWNDVRPEMRIESIIHPGQQFTLSDLLDLTKEKIWKKFNVKPFKKFQASSQKQLERDRKGLEILGLNKEEIDEVIEKHKKALHGSREGFLWDVIGTGDTFTKVLFGNFYIWRNVKVNWGNKYQPVWIYETSSGTKVWYPRDCGNWAIKKKVKFPSVPVFKSQSDFPLVPVFKTQTELPPVPVFKSQSEFPPVPVFEGQAEKEDIIGDQFDLYMGGGIYNSVHYNHVSGQYGWAKARWRPIKVKLSKTIDLGLGVFGFGALGSGSDDQYGYWWNQWNLGLTAKLIGKSWDADFDYGLLGRLWNKGAIDLYRSEQIDDLNFRFFSAHGNFYWRRDQGKKWFPKTEINFEGRWPRNISHERSWDGNSLMPDPDDNRNIELMLTQGIYDFKIGDNLMLTPGFNIGIGRAFGLDMNYYQLGPRIVLSYYNQDIASLSVLNLKEMLGGDGDQWHWAAGWISIGDVVKAIRASRIKEATAEDL